MSRSRVWIIDEAEQDLLDIYAYVAANDSVERAEWLLDKLEALCLGLAELPLRGHVPAELEQINLLQYREVLFKPYRVIYQVSGKEVYVHCVLDGRRDMQSLLERRLLR